MCDGPDFSTETFPKARKDYRCEECTRPIRRGTYYHKLEGKWDGEFCTFRQHLRCHNIAMKLIKIIGEDINFGEMREVLKDIVSHNRRRRIVMRKNKNQEG